MNPEPTPGASATAAAAVGCRTAADPGLHTLESLSTLCRTANYARRHLEHTVLRDARLTWTSYEVLHLTVMHRPIDTGVLAAIAGVSKGTVTRAAHALIKRGFIQRATPERDLRRSLLIPTPQGWALNQQLRQRLITELTRLVEGPASTDGGAALRRHLLHTGEPTTAVSLQDTALGILAPDS